MPVGDLNSKIPLAENFRFWPSSLLRHLNHLKMVTSFAPPRDWYMACHWQGVWFLRVACCWLMSDGLCPWLGHGVKSSPLVDSVCWRWKFWHVAILIQEVFNSQQNVWISIDLVHLLVGFVSQISFPIKMLNFRPSNSVSWFRTKIYVTPKLARNDSLERHPCWINPNFSASGHFPFSVLPNIIQKCAENKSKYVVCQTVHRMGVAKHSPRIKLDLKKASKHKVCGIVHGHL